MTKQVAAASNIVAVSAIIGIVILNVYAEEVSEIVNIGLIGAALGAEVDDFRSWVGKK